MKQSNPSEQRHAADVSPASVSLVAAKSSVAADISPSDAAAA